MANCKQSRQRHPRFGYRTALLAAVCFIFPQMVIANSLLHHFYVHGAPLYDAGWFAYWTTHALTLDVTTIPSINDRPILATHVFLFFIPLSWIYQIFSSFLSEQVYFSIVQGAWAGMVSLAIFFIGYRAINRWLLAVVSVATGLNPFVFTSTSFPHVEMAMPAFIALFIAFWVRLGEHRHLWWLPFLPLVGLLSVREDAGLHGFGLFILLTAYFYWRARGQRDLWRFFGLASLICIGYSVVALLVRQSFSVGDDIMVWKFTGSPPYAHLTADLIWERLAFIASNREYVYIPMLTLALLAILQRSLLPLIAVVSVLPWVLWHLIAKDQFTGTFFPYTMAPVMVVMFWPLSSALLREMTQEPDAVQKHSDRRRESTPPKFWSKVTARFDRRHILIAALLQLVLCVSLTAKLTGNENVRKTVVRDGFSFSYMGKIAPVDQATDITHGLIVDNAMGEFIMDSAMASLVLTDVRPHNVLIHEYAKFQYFDAAESAITFSSGFQRYFHYVNDRFVYYYPQADIYIVSKNAIAALDDTPFELQKLSEDGGDSAAFKAGWVGTNLGPLSMGQSSSVLVDANSDATLCFTVLGPFHPPEHPLEVAISYADMPTQSFPLDNKKRKDVCISMSELSGDVRVRFSVANPHQSEDDLNGSGLSITEIAWRK
ncbi:MAG: hypothetical protein F4Y79_17375 [Gemmatimonadetes bacterium]|nr:hypothetical protein [Gemmatimonadota bacterium]MYF15990.1 hypothetical protein [Gemmatimonadota bacterium]